MLEYFLWERCQETWPRSLDRGNWLRSCRPCRTHWRGSHGRPGMPPIGGVCDIHGHWKTLLAGIALLGASLAHVVVPGVHPHVEVVHRCALLLLHQRLCHALSSLVLAKVFPLGLQVSCQRAHLPNDKIVIDNVASAHLRIILLLALQDTCDMVHNPTVDQGWRPGPGWG